MYKNVCFGAIHLQARLVRRDSERMDLGTLAVYEIEKKITFLWCLLGS